MTRHPARRAVGGLDSTTTTARHVGDDSAFTTAVHELARKTGHTVRVRASLRARGASVRGSCRRGHVVTHGLSLTKEPAQVQQWVAAHEIAHAELGHHRWRAIAQSVAVFLVMCVTPFAWVAAPPMGAAAWLTVLVVVVVLEIVGMALALTRPLRPHEVAADALACAWGHHVTPEVEQWLTSAEPPFLHSRVYRPFRTHPMPAERATACMGHLGGEDSRGMLEHQ